MLLSTETSHNLSTAQSQITALSSILLGIANVNAEDKIIVVDNMNKLNSNLEKWLDYQAQLIPDQI